MDLDDGAVEQHRLQSEAHDPLPLQPVEDPVEHLVLEPAIHARVDGVPCRAGARGTRFRCAARTPPGRISGGRAGS